ncbi:hypothetical protein [Rhodopila globiformis]|uniref:hypothetical protein n=1 Tax=Rhodopila globiformis TaxID=1071 RepID=UPI0011B0E803|nr:hypothetical protein [Rhodopila globiformis]
MSHLTTLEPNKSLHDFIEQGGIVLKPGAMGNADAATALTGGGAFTMMRKGKFFVARVWRSFGSPWL